MSSSPLQKTLQDYGEAITKNLENFFDEVPALLGVQLSKQSVASLGKLREYSLRPSKRIRGSLAGFGYDFAAKTTQGQSGIQAGVAIELIQNYLLIIDDVMDKSDLRRGRPTLHKLYLSDQNEHLANMQAVGVGVVAQHLANTMMTLIEEDPARIQHALSLLHRNVNITCFGQLDDLSQQVGQKLTEQDIMRKYTFKSSYYTFINPLQVGLVLGGAGGEKTLSEVEEFGKAAGIAFQLHDDVMGIFGDTQKMGKSNLDDIKEAKYTLLLHYALEHATDLDKKILQAAIGNQDITLKDLEAVQKVLQKSDSKKFVEDKALWYAQHAKDVLNASTFWEEKAKKILVALVDYSITREK